LLSVLVLAFAFLAASFAARSSDVWLHLATGRLITQGQYTFGVDPFSYTTAGVYWANHAWLFDFALYEGFSSLGGAGLVVIKAGLVALLAGLMLRLARNGGPFWVSGGCVLLAVLAMSPRLLLQPTVLSMLLLAVCLLLLRGGGRALWALPAVVALWVNLDSWFWLGPLTVVLFGVGERLAPAPRRLPMWLLPACLAACLVSPHHVHGLTLPAELSPGVWRSGIRDDVRFAPLFASSWQLAPLLSAGGYNLAAWAYFALLLLGVASFAINGTALRDWRVLVWLTFAALGAWQARLVPFFAVVAGPITALNLLPLLDKGTRRQGEGETRRQGDRRLFFLLVSLSPRLLVFCVCLALIALSWPGWLQGFHRRNLHVAWRVHTDPSLQRVAHTLAEWRQRGDLPAGVRTFALHPDVAHYLAWFCPAEKSFFDSRLPLFLHVAAPYEQLCLALSGAGTSGWEKTLRDYDIGVMVLYDPYLGRLAPALRQITQQPQRWELLRVDGQAVLTSWKDAPIGPSPKLRFDVERAAFVHPEEAVSPPPPEAVPKLAGPRPWWERYLWGSHAESTWEAEAAAVYFRLFEDGAPAQLGEQTRRVRARYAAGLAGVPALAAGGVPTVVAMSTRLVLDDLFQPDLLELSPALPLLAVRAARAAIAVQPEQPSAWLALAQAYLALGRTTTEWSMYARLPLLAEVRYIQTVTALVQAVTLDPNPAVAVSAHEKLADLFAERGYLDLAMRHRMAQLRLRSRGGRLSGETRDTFDRRIERLEGVVEELRREVEDNENRFAVATASLAGEPLKRARIALQLGLAGKAIDDVLLRSHADLYGVEGIQLLLDLLLRTGRARDARELLDRRELQANPAGLGAYTLAASHDWVYRFGAFDWFDLCQNAAAGSTDRAAAALERIRQPMRRTFEQDLPRLRRRFLLLCAGEMGLGANPTALFPRLFADALRRAVGMHLCHNVLLLLVEQADLDVVEGMLLLEAGELGPAGERFRRAVPLYRRAKETAVSLPGQTIAGRYLQRLGERAP
jgi:hypothetical protein